MSSPQVVKIGNVTVNVAQFLFAEYTEAVKRPYVDPAKGDAPDPAASARPQPKPASLKVTFSGGSSLTFHGEDAEELRHQLDLLPPP